MRPNLFEAMKQIEQEQQNQKGASKVSGKDGKKKQEAARRESINNLKHADAWLLITIKDYPGKEGVSVQGAMSNRQFLTIFRGVNEWLQGMMFGMRKERGE